MSARFLKFRGGKQILKGGKWRASPARGWKDGVRKEGSGKEKGSGDWVPPIHPHIFP